MKTNQLGIILMAGMMIFPATAFAEVFEGVINSIDTVGRSLVMTDTSSQKGSALQRNIAVGEDTKFMGVNYLGDLHIGDRIRLDATPNSAGVLEAASIEKA